jgi:plasmid stabilization system protein ParE
MVYRVELSPTAVADLERIYEWMAQQSPQTAADWLEGCYRAVVSLEQFPERCSLAIESEALGIEIRQLLYKRKVRILFTLVREAEGDGAVRVHRIRHAAQRRLSLQEELEGEVLDDESEE